MGILGDYVDSVFEHSIYLQPPGSPLGYEPRDPTSEPTMSLGRTMLPVPKYSAASQECVEDHLIGKPADGGTTEVANQPEVASHSDGERKERAPLLYVRGERWSPGIPLVETPRAPSRGSMGERAFIALPTF